MKTFNEIDPKLLKKHEYFNNYFKVYNKVMIKCDCGQTTSRGGIYAHKKTKRHELLMEILRLK